MCVTIIWCNLPRLEAEEKASSLETKCAYQQSLLSEYDSSIQRKATGKQSVESSLCTSLLIFDRFHQVLTPNFFNHPQLYKRPETRIFKI